MSDRKNAILAALEKHTPAEFQPPAEPPSPSADIEDDYEKSRETYNNLIDKSTEAIESMLELAKDSEHPRAFEVLSNMLKNTADITDRLMELQKRKQDVDSTKDPKNIKNQQNNIFIGSTTELQKLLLGKTPMKDVTVIDT